MLDKKTNKTIKAVGKIGLRKQATRTLDKKQQLKIMEGIDYNLRGINTFNLFKRVVWSCVTDRSEIDAENNADND